MFALVLATATATGLSTFALVCALYGVISSVVSEVVKQDGWPKPVNALIANALLVVAAVLATFTDATFTWHNFASALVVASVTAATNHQFVLKGTNVGDWIQKVTTVNKR